MDMQPSKQIYPYLATKYFFVWFLKHSFKIPDQLQECESGVYEKCKMGVVGMRGVKRV